MAPSISVCTTPVATGGVPAPSAQIVEKRHVSYEQIHEIVRGAVLDRKIFDEWTPTLIVAIGAGGYIPARMLRTFIKHKFGKSLPIQAIGLALYEDTNGADPLTAPVRKTQWLTLSDYREQAGICLQGHNILVVDEVDDTRKTLSYAVDELQRDIAKQRKLYESEHFETSVPWKEPSLGTFVVHNKLKEKRGKLPDDIMLCRYFAGSDIDGSWVVYPWDALNIYEHTERAEGLQNSTLTA